MKLTATQYAKTLYEMTKDKSQPEIDEILEIFVKLLARKNQIKIADEIVEKFKNIANSQEGIVEAEIISREKLSGEIEEKLNEFIKEKYQAKKVVIDNKIDEKILGGIKIKIGDEVLDGSIKGALDKLVQVLKK